MTRPLLIENARLVDPASNTDSTGAVLVEDGLIADIAIGAPIGVPDVAPEARPRKPVGEVFADGQFDRPWRA